MLFRSKSTGDQGNMQLAGLTGAAPGPYGVYAKGTSTVRRSASTATDGVTTIDESWDFRGDEEAVQLQLQYVRGPVIVSKVDSRIYSGAKPDFYRIYRFDQGADVLRGVGVDGQRVKSLAFKATGGKFAALFEIGRAHV